MSTQSSPASALAFSRLAPLPSAGRARPAIALLLDYMSFLDASYQSRLTDAFHAAAAKFDVDLLILFGRALDEPNPSSRAHNGIFELVQPQCADGVVVVSTVLAAHCGIGDVTRFVDRYRGLPVVSVGAVLPSVPSVVVDNFGAMQAVVDHVITEHGRRRIAFLAGSPENPESDARLAGYRYALEQNGLPYDPALVGYGNFVHWTARTTLAQLLERAGSIDALVAANDTMAFGALDLLEERKLRVPADVVVTGFDGDLTLTTVVQPYERMAERALSIILGELTGEPIVHVPADVMLRRTCGCTPGRRHSPPQAEAFAAGSAAEHLQRAAPEIALLLAEQLRSNGDGTRELDAAPLFAGLRAELGGQRGSFLAALERMLRDDRTHYDRHRALHNAVDALREEFRDFRDPGLDDLWYQALSRIAQSTMTAGIEHRIRLDNEYLRLLATSDRASTALDLATLSDAIVVSIQNLAIPTAFIARFADTGAGDLEPLACVVNGMPAELTRRVPAFELVPKAAPGTERRTMLIFPLVFETQWLGVAAFEYAVGGRGYQMLRDQFAAALGHVTLHQQVLNKTMLHERSVQERQATSRRLEALGVLAGGVAHDLNNTLGPLVALPDLVIQELLRLDPADQAREVLEGVQADVQSMKSAALRAAQTIKDLLTLGRQGRAAKEALDLNRLVAGGLADPLRQLAKEHPRVEVSMEIHTEPLVIRGSEAHLTRAVTNLLRNAAEAIDGDGKIGIKTDFVRLPLSHSGYETIPAGEYATVSVSDTGGGIPSGELERVFEPFFSRKRLRDNSGSGLGLAIVHGVAKEHEGFVDLASRVGGGTTFTLYFPRAHEPSRVRSVPPMAHGRYARILVVDDDPLQARTARRVLTQLGYDIDVLDSGARAIEHVQRRNDAQHPPYDLLLLDVMLNEALDGLEVLRRIRRIHPEQRAIVASGRARGDQVVDEFVSGAVWLAKPYAADELARAVESALASPACSPEPRLATG